MGQRRRWPIHHASHGPPPLRGFASGEELRCARAYSAGGQPSNLPALAMVSLCMLNFHAGAIEP